MFTTAPKKGKKSSSPGTDTKPQAEETGSPYFYRCEKGGDEKRMREIYDNRYGKADKAVAKPRNDKGFPVSPRRTIITGS